MMTKKKFAQLKNKDIAQQAIPSYPKPLFQSEAKSEA